MTTMAEYEEAVANGDKITNAPSVEWNEFQQVIINVLKLEAQHGHIILA